MTLWVFCKLNEFLEDTEALLICGKVLEVDKNVVEYVFAVFLTETGDDFLKHMVALLVLCEQAHVVVLEQCLLDQFEFFLLSHCVNNVLQSICSPIVTRNFHKFVSFYLLQEMDPLVHLQVLYQLRAEVVPVVVRHQVW